MSITSKIIDFFSSTPGPTQPPKEKPQASRTWPSSSLTGGEKWKGGISNNGGVTVINTLKTLQNARSASHQSPQARVMIERPATLTVGTGLVLESSPAWKVLGITDDAFKEDFTSQVSESYDLYMHSKQCHRSRMLTGYQLQQLWAWCDGRDNDQFARLFYSNKKELVSRVQLEFIDTTLIRGTSFIDTEGQNCFRDGIQRNSENEETAYKIYDRVLKNGQWVRETKTIQAKGSRSGRVFMFHGFKPEYAGQPRGFSKLHFGLQDFQSIVDYVSSVTQKAINQSGMVGFVKPGDDAPASNVMEDQQGGPTVDAALGDDEIITASDFCFERTEYNTRKPGSDWYGNLMPGEEMQFLKDTSPGPEFDKYITSIFKYVSAARGYPIEVILMAFNSNYSASRAALLEAFQTGKIARQDMKADLMDIWFEAWFSEEIAAGRILAPGFNDPRLKQAWLKYTLQGPSLPSIDPAKDMGGIEKELKLGLNNQKKAAKERNGTDVNQNIAINNKLFPLTPPVPWEDKPDDGTEEPEAPNSNND